MKPYRRLFKFLSFDILSILKVTNKGILHQTRVVLALAGPSIL